MNSRTDPPEVEKGEAAAVVNAMAPRPIPNGVGKALSTTKLISPPGVLLEIPEKRPTGS